MAQFKVDKEPVSVVCQQYNVLVRVITNLAMLPLLLTDKQMLFAKGVNCSG